MSERGNTISSDTEKGQKSYFPEYVNKIFKRLDPQEVEQFYKSYQFWLLQQRSEILQIEIEVLQQAVTDNDELMQLVRPSAIALASLAQLQASGVADIALLDRMLARGEDWLDHSMQLLRYCEELDVIGGNYTQWCEHALEGAYDWIASMNGIGNNADIASELSAPIDQQTLDTATEEQLLQKLMSEDEETEKLPVISRQFKKAPIDGLPVDDAVVPLQQTEAAEAEEISEMDGGSGPVERTVTENVASSEEITLPTEDEVATNTEVTGTDSIDTDEIISTNDRLSPDTESISIIDEIVPETPIPGMILEFEPEAILVSEGILDELEDMATSNKGMVVAEVVSIEPDSEPTAIAKIESEQGLEGDNAPTMKRPARSKITRELESVTGQSEQAEDSTEVVEPLAPDEVVTEITSPASQKEETIAIQTDLASSSKYEQQQVLQVRQRGFWGFLRRLLAKIWRG